MIICLTSFLLKAKGEAVNHHILRCRLCNSRFIESVLALGDSPAGDLYKSTLSESQTLKRYPLNCNICSTCGHVQLSYFVDPTEIYSEYIYKTSDSLGLNSHFSEFANDLSDYANSSKKLSLFEIGCNDGTLLYYFKELGFETLGMDPASIPLKEARSKGLKVLESYFDKSTISEVKKHMPVVDVIVANNVLANVEDINSVFDGFIELLSDDGFIVFETGYLKYLAELKVIDNVHHEHIDYFAISPLVKFFETKGLYIDRVLINNSKGSSVRVFLRRGTIDKTPQKVYDICSHEVVNGYFDKATYYRLEMEIAQEEKRLRGLIASAKSKGLLVFGYGAAIGTTTLLTAFNIEKEIDFLLDDNPRRKGKFAPGTGILVRSFDEILDLQCSVIIFAWRYQDAIRDRIGNEIAIKEITSIWN
jgi:SAM-dependent methyltransferase